MNSKAQPILIATRGSALALAQANLVLAQCRAAFPEINFQIKIIKTTGDKLQTASLASAELPKGLFTKELETALLNGEADLAVHSLKDLPTELPPGLILGAIGQRADPRDVLILRVADSALRTPPVLRSPSSGATTSRTARAAGVLRRVDSTAEGGHSALLPLDALPPAATVATSSTRRSAQLLEHRPDLKVVPIRGNVPTRLKKLAEQPDLDAIVLAAAGLERLHFEIGPDGNLRGEGVPAGLWAKPFEPEQMLPCVGQAAIGIEVRDDDPPIAKICEKLDDFNTRQCVMAERAFLRAMGGGCQIAVAAYAEVLGAELRLRAVSYLSGKARRAEARRGIREAVKLGEEVARELGAEP